MFEATLDPGCLVSVMGARHPVVESAVMVPRRSDYRSLGRSRTDELLVSSTSDCAEQYEPLDYWSSNG